MKKIIGTFILTTLFWFWFISYFSVEAHLFRNAKGRWVYFVCGGRSIDHCIHN